MFKLLACFLLCTSFLNAHPKTLVLIISSENEPVYKRLKSIWKSYMNVDPAHFECYFIEGKPDLPTPTKIEENMILSKMEESIVPGILNKTLSSLEALSGRLDEFDYVLRANLSSFFVFPNLLKFLNESPREKFYCGIRHGLGVTGIESGWVCGAGIILSKDMVKLLLANKSTLYNLDFNSKPPELHYRLVDDVAISELMAKNGIKIQESKYLELFSIHDWLHHREKIPEDVFHIRVKTPDPLRNEIDYFLHLTLLQKYYPDPSTSKSQPSCI